MESIISLRRDDSQRFSRRRSKCRYVTCPLRGNPSISIVLTPNYKPTNLIITLRIIWVRLIVNIDDANNGRFKCYFRLIFRLILAYICTRRIKRFTNRGITFLYNLQDQFWNMLFGDMISSRNLINHLSLI